MYKFIWEEIWAVAQKHRILSVNHENLHGVRLIGRLFFKLGGRRLKLRSPFCILVVQVMTKPVADLEVFMGNPWANMGSLMGRDEAKLWAVKELGFAILKMEQSNSSIRINIK